MNYVCKGSKIIRYKNTAEPTLLCSVTGVLPFKETDDEPAMQEEGLDVAVVGGHHTQSSLLGSVLDDMIIQYADNPLGLISIDDEVDKAGRFRTSLLDIPRHCWRWRSLVQGNDPFHSLRKPQIQPFLEPRQGFL